MAKSKVRIITDQNELEIFENVSPKVSAKYVPIYTSEVVRDLAPEFKFVEGVRYCSYNTMHSVLLKNEDGDVIVMDNSYDRSRAFSLYFSVGKFNIPLNLDRQIHIGENARHLVEDLTLNKKDIQKAIEDAKTIARNFKDTHIIDDFKKEIIDIVFKQVKSRKNFVELDLIIADGYDNFFDFINTVIDRYYKGQYHVVKKTAKGERIHKGRVIKSRFGRLQISNNVYKHLAKNHIELFV